jgi:hypothetical protein
MRTSLYATTIVVLFVLGAGFVALRTQPITSATVAHQSDVTIDIDRLHSEIDMELVPAAPDNDLF